MAKNMPKICVVSLLMLLFSSAAAFADLPIGIPDIFPMSPSATVPSPQGIDPYQQVPARTENSEEGKLSGVVVDNSGRPLAGAEIRLQSGPRTYSDYDGSFRFDSVPAGVQGVRIYKSGYKLGQGRVSIIPGSSRTLKVSLSREGNVTKSTRHASSSAASQAPVIQRGNFEVAGKAMHVGPRDRRVWVYKIEVTDLNDTSRTWQNTWWDDAGQSSYTLLCDNAVIGHRYRIKITWRNHGRFQRERSNDWEVEFTRSGQTFSYDHPMN
ncbi:MAG: carboxypeptidase-like regulatory domain-containing protein [bacterium]|nr:carboxypeptidase-like regulatory domain-containing protein [bacterium]